MKIILETISDLDSERGVLGCCLVDSKKVHDVFDACGSGVMELFTHEHLRAVWKALLDVVSDGENPDLLQLSILLKKEGEPPSEGWVMLLTSLQDAVPSAENLSFYLESAKDAALKRKAGKFLTDTYQKLVESKGSAKRLLEEAEARMMSLNTEMSGAETKHLPQGIKVSAERIDTYQRGVAQMFGISSGYDFFDIKTGGLVPGEMIVIAGRPGGGKTALGLNMAINVAMGHCKDRIKRPVLFFSMEMSFLELCDRVLFSEAKANMVEFRSGCVQVEDYPKLSNAAKLLDDVPVWVDDRRGLSLSQICHKARQMKLMHKIELVVIDYLQLAHSDSDSKFESRQEEIAKVSTGIRNLAGHLNVPVIALAQLNRNAAKSKYEPPNLADLRESGQIEQDADFVGLLHEVIPRTEEEEKLTAGDDEYTKFTKLIIAKQRNGPPGEVHFKFHKEYVTFETFNHQEKGKQTRANKDDRTQIDKSIFDEAAKWAKGKT